MKLSKSKLRQLILQEIKELTNEEVVQAQMPAIPDDLESAEGQTPGWYVELVSNLDRLYQNDLGLEKRIEALEEKLGGGSSA